MARGKRFSPEQNSSLGYRPPAPVTRAFANYRPTSPTMQ